MLWMSLRVGCGNVGPLVGLGLLTLFATGSFDFQQQRSETHAAVPDLLKAYSTAAPTWTCELSAETPITRFAI
jgi:hypothetical protein